MNDISQVRIGGVRHGATSNRRRERDGHRCCGGGATVCARATATLIAVLAATGFLAPRARATDVDAAIVFAVDVSASIDPDTAKLQREGHAAALNSPQIIAAIARNRIGCIGIVYFEWSSRGHSTNVLPWTTVCGPSEAQAAAAIIREKGDIGNGLGGRRGTSVSYAIDMGSLLLGEFPGSATNKIIDISANGPNNDGLPVEQSRLRAIAKGYTINAIAIPSFMRGIEHDNSRYFAENVIGGPGAFVIAPATANDYAAAIRRKLVEEISLPINRSNKATSVNSAQSVRPLPEDSTVSGVVNLLSRTKETDPLIEAVHMVNRWGVIVASTEEGIVGRVPLQILLALSRSKEGDRTGETALDFIGRASIVDEKGTAAGSIIAIYPKTELIGRSRDVSVCASMRDNICAAEDRLFARRSGASNAKTSRIAGSWRPLVETTTVKWPQP